MLDIDGHPLNEDRATLNALTKACALKSDRIQTRFPIKKGLLGILIHQLAILYEKQPYLQKLYQAMFATAYL